MSKKFSLAHLTALELNPAELTYLAAKIGYDYVSIRPIPVGADNEPIYKLAEDKQLLKETKQALESTGLEILDIEMVRIYDGVDAKEYERHFEVGAELGAKHVLTTILTDDKFFALEKFIELCELAKPYGLTIDLEFLTWYNCKTLQEAKEVLVKANCDNAGILVDTLHFHRSKVQLEELDACPKEWFHYVHVCDAEALIPNDTEGLIYTAREARLYPGEGGIDIKGIVDHLPDIPYSLEIPHAKRVNEYGYEEHARRCLEKAKEYFSKET
ncbi:sugar phosphate isomerase/epimerase [Caldifermentibacillus hisashii]|jgi:sugar phosphate isomerase/epimerase|uniref:sugar phosphate isomerase/epimerase family protein n=1 Tax=Caldifermentibacillus hisashii TaxID=996558 RepID=UPI0031FBAAEA